MKQIIFAYLLVSLIIIAFFSVFSYGYGSGYIYLYWRNWQVQTNVWVLLIFTLFASFVFQIIWLLLKRYISKEQRKKEDVLDFSNLHPYEQLGVLWLVEAAQDQPDFILQIFEKSGLLNHVIAAELLYGQTKYSEALERLEQSPASAFELAELLRIKIFLAQEDSEQVLTHLEFLSQHELSPWLHNIENAYKSYLSKLWGQYAVQNPWGYLRSTKAGYLDENTNTLWLQQLLVQFDKADLEDIQALQQRYQLLQTSIPDYNHSDKILWLKLIARIPDMGLQHEELSLALLNEQFDQEVFYLWFQQQLLKQNPDYDAVENEIKLLEDKYQGLPVLSYAKWHVLMATQRESEANQLLTLYPENNFMNYLRIRSTLNGDRDLIQQLNMIFENDANFLKFKI
nr:heme biosynthesis protein HemY [Acinetobacter sp. Marseille-Q1620]